jgi:flagellar biosynthetic protein FliR
VNAFNDTSVIAFMLALCRIGGGLAVAPVFSRREAPVRVKMVAAALIALVAMPGGMARAQLVSGPLALGVLAAAETVTGLLLGFAAHLVFAAARMAGDVLGRQVGLGLAAMADPATGAPSSLVGEIFCTLGLLVFLTADGHLAFLAVLVRGLPLAPAGLPELAAGVPRLTGLLDTALGAALSLAAPVMVISFLVSVSLALLARAAPQANILLVGFPLKLGIGLAALAFFTPLMGWALYRLAVRVAPAVGTFAGGG